MLKDLDNLIDPHRNEKLYAAIRERLEAHGGKGDKAFPSNNPLRKPDRDGNLTGPIVRTVTKVIDKQSGIPDPRRASEKRHHAAGGRVHQKR